MYQVLSYSDHQAKLIRLEEAYNPEVLEIPENVSYKGELYAVVSIGSNFIENESITMEGSSLRELKIPQTIFNIEGDFGLNESDATEFMYVMKKCPLSRFRKITVDKRNPYFTSIHNVIYTKDMKVLVYSAPCKRKIHIPDTVERIYPYAFTDSRIKEFHLPENLFYLDSDIFCRCHIKTLYIGSILKSIIMNTLDFTIIEKITLSPQNKNFLLENGILYSKDNVIRCTPRKSKELTVLY